MLHQAAMEGDANGLRELLKTEGEAINVRDVNGWMPLHVSILKAGGCHGKGAFSILVDLTFSCYSPNYRKLHGPGTPKPSKHFWNMVQISTLAPTLKV